jgi:hypothetical protein
VYRFFNEWLSASDMDSDYTAAQGRVESQPSTNHPILRPPRIPLEYWTSPVLLSSA